MRAMIVSGLLMVLVLSGCGSTAPDATPATTPAASAGTPAGSDPTLVPGAVTAPPLDGSLAVTAANIAFEPTELAAPAGTTVLTLHNRDSGVPHNIEIKDASGGTVFKGDIVTGPADTAYSIPDLQPGVYAFMCSVHPNMTGTLTIVP